jgi:hypothetical protein
VAIYVKKDNTFEQAEPFSRECPHCGAHAQLIPVSTPSFEAIRSARPRQVGIAFRCAACNEPRFGRAAVRAIDTVRVELSSSITEIERSQQRFPYSYLPPAVERIFNEALQCYAADCHNAFASMCRRTIQTAVVDLGANARLQWFELYKEVVTIAEVDEATAQALETVLFSTDGPVPEIGADHAAVLVEMIKDMVYQSYVRTAKLRAAMKMRRYFAEEHSGKITSIDRHRAESA